EANKVVKEEKEITVYVSLGPEQVEFDDYVGREYERVEAMLIDDGYNDVRYYEEFSDKPVGEIIAQYQPATGEEVIPRQTNVIFDISKGPETISLSRLIGLNIDEATSYLEKHELTSDISETHHEEIEEGQIIDQSPSPNTEVQ